MTDWQNPSSPEAKRSQWLDTTVPTKTTVFFRTFFPWQLLRFAAINLRMMTIIRSSHNQKG